MSTTLYLLRQPAEDIPASIFLASEREGDVVMLATVGRADGSDGTTLTYDALIERIFAHDHVMVI